MEDKYFVGIDLHRYSFTACGTDDKGNILLREKYLNSVDSVVQLVNHFSSPPQVVIEATRNWQWLVRCLRDCGSKVVLAHPFKLKAIASARIKTDNIDARILSHLLRTDLIPQSYIASKDELDNRELSRGRVTLVHEQTMSKNHLRAILAKENLNCPASDLLGNKGQEWLTMLLSPDNKFLSWSEKQMITIYLKRLKETQTTISKLEKLIQQKSNGDPRVLILNTIPGIGPTTAFLLLAEIGDIKRFNTSKQFASYFGFVPRLNQSGNHAYYGRITKLGNPYVRWSLVQTAHRLVRMDKAAQRFVNRISFKSGKKKAIVALARKLATIIYCVLKENRPYVKDYCPGSRPAIIPERVIS